MFSKTLVSLSAKSFHKYTVLVLWLLHYMAWVWGTAQIRIICFPVPSKSNRTSECLTVVVMVSYTFCNPTSQKQNSYQIWSSWDKTKSIRNMDFSFGVTDVEKVGEPPAFWSQNERLGGKQVYIRPSNQYWFSGVTFGLESERPPNRAQP